jgi:hypothetical protein
MGTGNQDEEKSTKAPVSEGAFPIFFAENRKLIKKLRWFVVAHENGLRAIRRPH